MKRGVVASCVVVSVACGILSHGPSSPLSGYRVLIESRDSLSEYLARALARRGFTVRRRVAGGSPPTAVLVTFNYPGEGPSPVIWFAARLADTRTGAVLAAVTAPLDSLAATLSARAEQLADSLAARISPP